MQFWPRKRAKRSTPRVRSWADSKEAKPLAFAGYKAGMTHVIATDAHKNSPTKGQDIMLPATIIECPPMKIFSVRCYQAEGYGVRVAKEMILSPDKDLERKISLPKKKPSAKIDDIKPEDYTDITIICSTQPKKIGFKKKPDLVEIHLGGSNEEKLAFIKEFENKELTVGDIYSEGDYVDIHAITTGRGFQGAVKRFGIGLKSHKSEKGQRTPGSLGGWKGHAHFMYRIAHAGQTGYHQRVQYNNQILKISDKPEEVNPKGGIIRYGDVKNTFVLVQGSVPGPKKRLITMAKPLRLKVSKQVPTVQSVSKASTQGR